MSTPSDKSQHLGTASSPTEHVSSLATLAAQRQTEPAKLTKLLRGDLDWVVMKALEKERNRRFETASGLAMDLRRYLADEPVQASPPSARYRLRKMIRRNKGPVVAVGLVSFALLGGVIGTTWGMLAARRSAAAAREEAAEKDLARKQAVEQRERAEKAERAARADRDRAISAEKAALAEASEKEKARDQAVSERGRAEAAELDAKRDRDRAVDAEADTKAFSLFLVRNVLAVPRPEGVAGGQGIDVTMSQALEAAEQDIERVFAERPKAEAEARHTIGMTWLHLGRYTKAEQHLRRVVQLRERFLGPTDLDTLISRDVLSIALVHAGRGREAVPLCEVTLDQLCKTVGPDHPETLNCMNNLGRAYDAVGRVSESLALLKRTNDQHHKILGHDHRNTLISMSNLGLELLKTGQLEEAIQLLQSVLDLRIKRIGPDHPETLIAMNNLASAFRDAGQWKKAATLYEETLRNKKKKFGPDHPSTFLSMHNLAHVYAAEERVTEAQPLSDVAVNGLVSKLGPAHPWTKAAQNAQRSIRELQMRLDKYNQSLSANGLDHLDTLASREQLAYALRNLSNPAAAEVHMRAVYEGRLRTLGAEDRRTLSSKLEIGYLQNLQRKYGDAESTLRDVLAIYTKSSPDLWVTFVGKSLLGASLLEQRKYAEAEPLLVEGYEGMYQREATIPAPIRRSRILQALERIVRLYGAWDQKDKLNEWSKKLEQLNQELANQEQEPETASSSPSP